MPETVPYDPVAAAKALAPQIRAARDEVEELRRIPASLVKALSQAGLLQLHLPRSLGGRETDPITAYLAIEEISKIDGSVGWCAFLSSDSSIMMGWIGREAGLEIVGQPPDSSFAGSLRPQGVAFAVDGGYRVSGRWDFVSGGDHAKWLLCTCKVVDAAGPVMRRTGVQDTRTLVLPIKSVQVRDV